MSALHHDRAEADERSIAHNAATTRTIQVDPIADDNPGIGCTLREAIDVANAGLGPGLAVNGCSITENGSGAPIVYVLNLPGYTYTLAGSSGEDANAGGDLDIFAHVRLNGSQLGGTILDGAGNDRILDIPVPGIGIQVTIHNLTIQNGLASAGGGIRVLGNRLALSDCEVSANHATGNGGGVYSSGGTVSIDNSLLAGNLAGGPGGGLSLTAGSAVSVTQTVISGNQAESGGGVEVSYSANPLNIRNSTVANNITTSGRKGAGLYAWQAHTNILNSTFSGNQGGGIHNAYSTLNIANSTITGNTAQVGAGVFNQSKLNMSHVTIAGNTAGAGKAGGVFNQGTLRIRNSMMARNFEVYGGEIDCSGSFSSFGYNLIGNNFGCIASFPAGLPNANNDYAGTGSLPLDPQLDGLTGDPAHYLLQLASPAVDQIPAASCTYLSQGPNPLFAEGAPVFTDQAGNARDTSCDIGAYEVPPVGVQVLSGNQDIASGSGVVDVGRTQVGQPITRTFTVRNTGKAGSLTLSNLAVPAGFSIAGNFGATTVPTGSQTTFAVQLDAAQALDYIGQVAFTNNVPIRSPFYFTIQGSVVRLTILYLPQVNKN